MALRYNFTTAILKTPLDGAARDIFMDVMYLEEESLEVFNPLPDYLEQYHHSQCLKYTGLTFQEWLDLPIPMKDIITEVCGQLRSEDNEYQANMLKDV